MSKFVALTNDGFKDNIFADSEEVAQDVRHLRNGLPDAFGDGDFNGFLLALGEQAADGLVVVEPLGDGQHIVLDACDGGVRHLCAEMFGGTLIR